MAVLVLRTVPEVEALRMGERVATGTLREHLSQIDEPVELDFHSFDGDHVHLRKTGGGSQVTVHIEGSQGATIKFEDGWVRHLPVSAPISEDAEPERCEAAELIPA